MSDQPDLSTLPARMRYTVNHVLQEVFDKDRNLSDKYGMALMCDLLDAASNWSQEAERVEELARDLQSTYFDLNLDCDASTEEYWRKRARKLIESGWCKGDPA
jgi:hypothetical protein